VRVQRDMALLTEEERLAVLLSFLRTHFAVSPPRLPSIIQLSADDPVVETIVPVKYITEFIIPSYYTFLHSIIP
jgi:hypothetical protein